MKCCLCHKDIAVHNHWTQGHNAQPLKKGRCCDKCNYEKVIPTRLQQTK